jgi:hypothetical protein
MVARPRLKEQFRPLRRGHGRVQLGLDPAVGVVLEGLTDEEVRLLEHLDGSLDEASATAWATRQGIPAERVATLLSTLRTHSLTVEDPAHRLDLAGLSTGARDSLQADAAALACAYRSPDDGYAVLGRRARRQVVVCGAGTLPAVLVQALRQAGVGQVLSGRYAGEEPQGHVSPDLVVLAGVGAVAAEAAGTWWRRQVPHLPVVLHGTSAEVGPLVVPGNGPCLRCVDLTRADHDPGWPAVLAQLTPAAVGPPAEASGETSLVFATAGLAAMAVLAALDGHPQQVGTSWRLGLPVPRLIEQVWPRHPHCAAHDAEPGGQPGERAVGALGDEDPDQGTEGPGRGSPPASATMAV